MIKKRIKIPIYLDKLLIIQTDNFEKIQRKYNLRGIVDYCAITFQEDKEIVVVFNSKVDTSIVAHEALHICSYIFKNTGAEFDRDNDEPLAYLLGYIVKKISKVIKIRRRKTIKIR